MVVSSARAMAVMFSTSCEWMMRGVLVIVLGFERARDAFLHALARARSATKGIICSSYNERMIRVRLGKQQLRAGREIDAGGLRENGRILADEIPVHAGVRRSRRPGLP